MPPPFTGTVRGHNLKNVSRRLTVACGYSHPVVPLGGQPLELLVSQIGHAQPHVRHLIHAALSRVVVMRRTVPFGRSGFSSSAKW